MDPIIGGALLGLGSSLINTFTGNKAAKDSWKAQAEYNSPVNQMARLQKAGLNPHLVYGQSVSGATGNQSQSADIKGTNLDPVANAGAFAAAKLTKENISLVEKQKESIDSAIKLNQANELKILADTDTSKLNNQFLSDSYQTRLEQLAETLSKTKEDKKLTSANIGLTTANTGLSVANTQLSQENKLKVTQEIKNLNATLTNTIANTNLTNLKAKTEVVQRQILEFERQLNQMGITKNDPMYFRILNEAVEKVKESPQIWKGIKQWFKEWWSGTN